MNSQEIKTRIINEKIMLDKPYAIITWKAGHSAVMVNLYLEEYNKQLIDKISVMLGEYGFRLTNTTDKNYRNSPTAVFSCDGQNRLGGFNGSKKSKQAQAALAILNIQSRIYSGRMT